MKNSNSDYEIPGFYRDPNTGKYFRRTCDALNQVPVKKLEEKRKRECILEANKKARKFKVSKAVSTQSSLLNLVTWQENGLARRLNFNSEFLKMKTRQLLVTNELRVDKPSVEVTECEFVRGTDNSIIGVWRSEAQDSAICELTFEYNSPCSRLPEIPPIVSHLHRNSQFMSSLHINDICDAYCSNQSCLLYVGNDATKSIGSVVLAVKGLPTSCLNRRYVIKKVVWSCTCNTNTELFAAGTEKGCFIFDINGPFRFRELSGNAYSVEFSENGNMLYCGLHLGLLIGFDVRSFDNTALTIDLGKKGICDTKLLSGEQAMIIGGLDGKLSKVDFKMRKRIIEYPGHVSSAKKIPFSFSEEMNLLCATGSDDITRIWSLDRGEPLYSILPPVENLRTRSWLMCKDKRWFINILQGCKLYTYEARHDI